MRCYRWYYLQRQEKIENKGLDRPSRHLNPKGFLPKQPSNGFNIEAVADRRSCSVACDTEDNLNAWYRHFSTQDTKILLTLGEKLLDAFINGGNIAEMSQVLRACPVRGRPWRHNFWRVAHAHSWLRWSMCSYNLPGEFVIYPEPEVLHNVGIGQNALALDNTWSRVTAARFKQHHLRLRGIYQKANVS